MPFSKAFPKKVDGASYPKWEEVYLTYEEEITAEDEARKENLRLMRDCLKDAKGILGDTGYKDEQNSVVRMAIALFEKRSSHEVHWKEKRAKEKFDKLSNAGKPSA